MVANQLGDQRDEPVRVADLDYELPPELVARYPSTERDASRLLVLHERQWAHRVFSDVAELLPSGALLVVNDTRVRSARLFGRKHPSGGRVEVLLVRQQGDGLWQAMARSSKKLRAGGQLKLGETLDAEVARETDEHGLLLLRLSSRSGESLDAAIAREGHVPLPPYLRRADEPSDRERYQTVFASKLGAVAAPTAGLHFTEPLLAALAARGVECATITLHVGPGTFRPVSHEELNDHPMHHEHIVVPQQTVTAIERARARGGPVVAVGTTVVRALESAADDARPGLVQQTQRDTDLLIQPGYRFKVVDALITNFHLPRSTLLALVYAFAGSERVQQAYREAVAQRYRFYSYGDAMLILRGTSPAARPPSSERHDG